MATSLPPIAPEKRRSPTVIEDIVVVTPKLRGLSARHRGAIERHERMKLLQPRLTRLDTARYRNTYKHSLFLDMLREGFHRSYCELSLLMKYHSDEREKAGPDSAIWYKPVLENEPIKCDAIKEKLIEAELSSRSCDFFSVYSALLSLAEYFETSEDYWLSEYFHNRCLEASGDVTEDGGRSEAEAERNVGRIYYRRGDLTAAERHFETFYGLASGRQWFLDDESSLHSQACELLTLLYTRRADDCPTPDEAVDYLLKAFNMSREGGDAMSHGRASYRLGQAYELIGDPETALTYLNAYLEISEQQGDMEAVADACEFIAKSMEAQGNTDECLKYLHRFEEVARESGSVSVYSRSCRSLGVVYNSMGDFRQASDYFSKAFQASQTPPSSRGSTESAAVSLGIAKAHNMFLPYSNVIEHPEHGSIPTALRWKDKRDFPKDHYDLLS